MFVKMAPATRREMVRYIKGCCGFFLTIDSMMTVQNGEVARMHCCSATDSSSTAVLVQPMSVATNTHTTPNPTRISFSALSPAHCLGKMTKTGTKQTTVAMA